jgi:hypothetical protein
MLQVVSIGRIVQDPACYGLLVGKPIIFPDCYVVHRAAFLTPTTSSKPTLLYKNTSAADAADAAAAMEKPFFTAAIAVVSFDTAGPVLRFTITRSDDPAGKVYTGTTSATSVWRAALEGAVADFPEQKSQLVVPYDAKGRLQVNGIRLFGLHLKEIQEELMALPGGAAAFEQAAALQRALGNEAVSPPASQPAPTTASATRSAGRRITSTSPTHAQQQPQQHQPGGKSESRKRTGRAASTEQDTSLLPHHSVSTVTINSVPENNENTNSPPPSVVAVTPVKAKRTRKAKADGVAVQDSTASPSAAPAVAAENRADSSPAPPPVKRRRASARKETNDAVATTTGAASVMPVCADCGLAGTPFCAATGRPHEVPPCPVCGLRTAFCPVSGQPHTGTIQRENRQRGEVHLPGASRKPRAKKAGPKTGHPQLAGASASGEVSEVTVVNTQEGSGDFSTAGAGATESTKPRKRRARAASAGSLVAGMTTTTSSAKTTGAAAGGATANGPSGGTQRKRRSKKEIAVTDTAVSAHDATGDAPAVAVVGQVDGTPATDPSCAPEGEKSLFELAKESVYIYPPLRPPLSSREHHKAAQLMHESWKAQYGDGPVLPPSVAAVPLALVPVKRTVAVAGTSAATAGGASRGRRKGQAGAIVKDENHSENGTGGAMSGAPDQGVEGVNDHDQQEGSALSSAVGSPAAASAPSSLTSLVHPLEVTQLTSSVAGKRLAKFLLQYASERSQFDLLRSHAAGAAGGGEAEKKGARGRGQMSCAGVEEDGGDAVQRQQQQEGDRDSNVASTEAEEKQMNSEAAEVTTANGDELAEDGSDDGVADVNDGVM